MNYKHGKRHTVEYQTWCSIKDRCFNPASAAYKNYGGRGILMCDEWRNSFPTFLRDMGERPPGMSIERKDNNLGYSPQNCVWATWTEQQRNKRTARLITANGQTLSVVAWAEKTGLKARTIAQRLHLGWTEQDAVTIPLVKQRKGTKRGERLHKAFGAERGVTFSEMEAA